MPWTRCRPRTSQNRGSVSTVFQAGPCFASRVAGADSLPDASQPSLGPGNLCFSPAPGRLGDAKRRPQTRVQIDVDVARCPISRRRPPPVPPQCGPGFRERGRAPPHVCQSLKDHRGRAVRQTLARGRRPSQTRDAAAGDLARDPLSSCRHSQSKELEQRGRRTTRGRCQDAHGSRGSGCRTEDPTSARGDLRRAWQRLKDFCHSRAAPRQVAKPRCRTSPRPASSKIRPPPSGARRSGGGP